MVQIKFTPIRPWKDFFPGAERFAIPDFHDLPKWNNRMICNLLYYQTNYILMAVVVFLIVGFMDPIGMFIGAAVVVAVFLGAEWAAENKAIIKNFKKENPILFVFFVLLASYLLIPLFGEVMVFLLAFKLPQF
ncbi:PRA1 family protein 3-like, partial [Clarias magur]